MTANALEKEWDVIVIGTGIGGGTIGRRLAELGLSVLFVEKGPSGHTREQHYLRTDLEDPSARQIRGLWPKPVVATLDGKETRLFGAIGSGVGGSSSFYAATLERPETHDIDDGPDLPHPTGGWPVRFSELRPYYEEAERLYEVCGDPVPLSNDVDTMRTPPPLSEDDQAMADSFRKNGLHPYHVHMGVRLLPGCKLCFGHKCPRRCKLDGRTAGVEPALQTGNAVLLDMCEVQAICGTRDRVTHLEVLQGGKPRTLRARSYVLAAGALGSPKLLLASRSEIWPNGFGNDNDLVGRNLMFHLTEMVAIWPASGSRSRGASKALALRDFYHHEGRRFGALQAIGVDASYGMIVHYLNGVFDRSPLRHLRFLREATRIPAYFAARIFGSAKIFSGIIEDLPYRDNRVLLDPEDPERIRFTYNYAPELQERRRLYRRIVKRSLVGHRTMWLRFEPHLDLAHCCGTLRFGNDPAESVLDRDCRVHGVSNLYVADASFMPTSLGINPSLTIAANALRVADRISALRRQQALQMAPV
ncbi:GMC family oxidoreductase [Mesorhizobium sp. AR10]|uniref:GMC oxidoreductase n=1 Tax=Mesorhizobium sp. AR10 TaxID=2865839 RepID=UPI00215F6C8D|nr:GMC family oxidoreductase [Mesorhizobium sp. AR10]UVK40227.1 GMC family oxidoreductase [Mesorhizobium sp. AR10]